MGATDPVDSKRRGMYAFQPVAIIYSRHLVESAIEHVAGLGGRWIGEADGLSGSATPCGVCIDRDGAIVDAHHS